MKENAKESIEYMKNNKKGITLVALVVTIVVLLILAGVTITVLFGENGIIAKAQRAKEETKSATLEEQQGISNLEDKMDTILNGGGSVTKGEIVTGSNATYTDSTSTEPAKIPVGFCVVKDIEGDANTIASGLVISDVADDDLDNSKHGNQFVWIPVDYSKFHLIEGYSGGNPQTYLSKASNPSREAGASLTEISPGLPYVANSVLGTAESVAMYKSVQANGGFYIARFEAGIAETTASGSPATDSTIAQDGTVKPVSQKGVDVWNSIPWGGSSSDTALDKLPGDDTVNGAVKVARSMYNNPITGSTSTVTTVKSTLCYGVQWDATLNFIDSEYEVGTASEDSFVVNSTNMGNYSGNVATTGSNTAYQQKHIYDLAGNVSEWTMEANGTGSRVFRGGFYGSTGSGIPASNRIDSEPSYSNFYGIVLGFRLALYL